MARVPGAGPLGVTIGFTAVAVVAHIAYWAVWFANPLLLATTNTACYFVHQNSFPVADAWIALSSLLATIGLLRRHSMPILWLPMSAATSLYLTLLDFLFDLQNGIFLAPTGDWAGVGIEIAVLIANVIGAAWVAHFTWTYRHWFLSLEKASPAG